jgi:hypothetical protein
MFIGKTLKIIININLHYFPPMCQCQKFKVTHEVMFIKTCIIHEFKLGIALFLKYPGEIHAKGMNG